MAHNTDYPLADISAIIITVSDRSFAGRQEDKSGPRAAESLIKAGFTRPQVRVIPDGIESVRDALKQAIADGYRLIVTTGGTGIGPRDLTPEATAAVIATRIPGIENQILHHGLSSTPTAGLSRPVIGLTDRSSKAALIINAPGSTGGVTDTLDVITPLCGHIFSQLAGGKH